MSVKTKLFKISSEYGGLGCNLFETVFNSWSCLAGVVLLLTSSLRLILQTTRCEGGVGGIFGLAGQEVTKIASGQLEVRLT
eukprot:1003626-Pelagomonas_calceolata.AAC.1